jgi:adenylate cyclase class 2
MVFGTGMLKPEIEIKLRIEDPGRMIAALQRLGARLRHDREFEDNLLYDFPDRSLLARGAMLRLRTTPRGALLTYKEGGRLEDGAKVRDEIETALPDGGAMTEILARLGMVPGFHYQKYRTTYRMGGLDVTLDETPVGIFVELEGPKREIDAAAGALGFKRSDYIVDSYRDLYLKTIREGDPASEEMLFSI